MDEQIIYVDLVFSMFLAPAFLMVLGFVLVDLAQTIVKRFRDLFSD